MIEFQSTAPSQRLTESCKEKAFKNIISIHSPIAEADTRWSNVSYKAMHFNPQPHRRGWLQWMRQFPWLQKFQSTAPSQRLTANIPIFFTYSLFFLLNYTISPYYTQVILLLIPISIKTLIKLPSANLSQFSCALGIRTKVILVQKTKLSINFYEHHRPYT